MDRKLANEKNIYMEQGFIKSDWPMRRLGPPCVELTQPSCMPLWPSHALKHKKPSKIFKNIIKM